MDALLSSLNQEQKAAVLCEKTAVCAAGAGSGKTRVISSRFAYLVTEKNYKVDQILTLTFTKKAAMEMYKRIYETLKNASRTSEGRQKQNALEALESFHKANIKTTDAYCNAVLKQCAMRYGIKNDFEIDNKKCALFASDEALPFLLENASHSAITEFYREKNLEDIAKNIFVRAAVAYNPIDKKNDFFEQAKTQTETVVAEYEKSVKKIDALLFSLFSFAEDSGKKEKKNKTDENLIKAVAGTKNQIVIPQSNELKEYFTLLLEEENEKRVSLAKTHPVRTSLLKTLCILEAIKKIRMPSVDCELKTVLGEFRQTLVNEFYPLAVFCVQSGVILSVLELVCSFQNKITEKKRTLGVLTFDDVARLALKALKEQDSLRKSEQKKIKAIMIDEFQDNNSLQKELLFLLAGEKKDSCLFFVGDEKQSIYKFRGADVAVFNELKSEIADLHGENLSLKTNYRSSAILIQIFNDIFPIVFAYSREAYEASYLPLEAGKQTDIPDAAKTAKKNFSVCVLDKSEKAGNAVSKDENEAFFVAKKIHELLTKKESKLDPSDIAILFRATTHQFLFEKYLSRFSVPYTSEKISGLFSDAPVNDMMAALRLTAYPNDPLARAQVDCSPLITQKILSDLKEKSYAYSVSALVSEIWYALGYRYETLWNKSLFIYKDLYEYLFKLACSADSRGLNLASFCDEIAAAGFGLSNNEFDFSELDLPLNKKGAVNLMTVHKSKGLEFKIVFVVGCGNKGRNHGNTESIYQSGCYGFSLNPPVPLEIKTLSELKCNYFFERDRALENAKEAAELKRLLYVAFTRAEEQLFVTGTYALKKTAPENETDLSREKHPASFFDLFLPAIIDTDAATAVEEIPQISYSQINPSAAAHKTLDEVITKAKPFYKNAKILQPETVISNRITPTKIASLTDENAQKSIHKWDFAEHYSGKSSQDIFGSENIERVIEVIGAAGFGEFVHSYIESKLKNNPHALKRNLLSKFDEKKCAHIIECTQKIADNFFESAAGVMCKNAAWVKNELRFRTLSDKVFSDKIFSDKVFIDGTIDLLFEDAYSGEIFIVDFKTDKTENAQAHTAQLKCYLDAVNNIYTGKTAHAVLYYLRSGRAFMLKEISQTSAGKTACQT